MRIENEPEASSRPVAPAPNRPLITVIVPVYNGGEEIIENVAVIRGAVTSELDAEDVEVIVVSDGSIDGTDEMLLAARSELGVRVIHYDRNLGKGYAVKLGALRRRGNGSPSSTRTSTSIPRRSRRTSTRPFGTTWIS